MKIGSTVVVLAKLDSRIREKNQENELVKGTIFAIHGNQVSVLLQNGDIYEGELRNVALAKDQE